MVESANFLICDSSYFVVGRNIEPAILIMHPYTRITAQAADEEGVVVFNFEVVAVERFGFYADADHGLPVAAVVNQFVPGFEVGSIDPVGVGDVAVIRFARWGLRRCGVGTVLGKVRVFAVRDNGLLFAVLVGNDKVCGIRVGTVDGTQHGLVFHQPALFVARPDFVFDSDKFFVNFDFLITTHVL